MLKRREPEGGGGRASSRGADSAGSSRRRPRGRRRRVDDRGPRGARAAVLRGGMREWVERLRIGAERPGRGGAGEPDAGEEGDGRSSVRGGEKE